MTLLWRLGSVVGALLLGFLVPLAVLVVVLGVAKTGVAGALAVAGLVVVAVVATALVRRRLRT